MSDNKFDELREALEKVEPDQFAEKTEENSFSIDDLEPVEFAWASTCASYSFNNNVTIGGYQSTGAGSYTINTGVAGSSLWGSTNITTSAAPSLNVTGEANFEGDIKWQGRSLGNMLEKIEDRLAIISEPTPEKLEKFAALKKAYDHYKLMEKLIGEE
jgi:hypothetical protein